MSDSKFTLIGKKLSTETLKLITEAGLDKTDENLYKTTVVAKTKDNEVYLRANENIIVKSIDLKDAEEGDTILFNESGEIVDELLVTRKKQAGRAGGSPAYLPTSMLAR